MTRRAPALRAVLWDADGVLQDTPPATWDLAVRVVEQFPGALVGAPLDEARLRAAATDLGLGDDVERILTVWSSFQLLEPSLDLVRATRTAGVPCCLASNQDVHRARAMGRLRAYAELFERRYFSCDLGAAKPSTAFFDHIAADLGTDPTRLLFLDDQPANVTAARAAGLAAEQWSHHDGTARLRALLLEHGVPLDE